MTAATTSPEPKRSDRTIPAEYPPPGLLIDGEWIFDRPAASEVRNPADGSVMAPVPAASEVDLDRALQAAERGFSHWRKVPVDERAALLRRTAALMRERTELIASTITWEQGKTIGDARREVGRAASFLEWDAEQLLRIYDRVVPPAAGVQMTVTREPVGVVAAFTPWNVPLSSPGRKLGGTIAAGCAVIIKPAGETPSSVCQFAQCFIDAGLPDGVLQVVLGRASEISTHLIGSPIVQAVTLTGSVEVGKTLLHLAADGIKPALMELGGHAPVLIDKGIDPEHVAKLAIGAKFRMAGQICVSPSRFLVHSDVYGEFVDQFAGMAQKLVVGDGFAAGVDMGPMMNDRRVEYIDGLVTDSVERGARLASGGYRLGNAGSYYAPTIVADVPLDADVMNLEPFGPIAACRSFDDIDEAVQIANSLEVGLASYVFTNDAALGDRLAAELQTGSVAINNFGSPGANAPFGGLKESGIGTEGGDESLDAYLVTKTVLRSLAH